MQTKNTKEKWFDTNIVVEVLIGEVSSKPGDAPAIASLCIGFNSLSKEKLGEEINSLREWRPRIFPKSMSTEKILGIVEKKYPSYCPLITNH
ncbi:hypothetical protein HOF56_04285 [Candidatus Peribacteria bacterium]|jgi:hypothetical protein|nr:hypothetical protein [Candidatus Peribacteria bacterium]MBT4020993.1 hypothetical protein [Candidatus Peribacteria bacterium]MBT4240892.1 hypothetical protein [Candidatus Peribacteria bacterium]MBT4474115.1 hypothetical protein [Candidatus Peribacteria bacterium]